MDEPPNPDQGLPDTWLRPRSAWVGGAVVVLVVSTALALQDGLRPGEEGVFALFNDLPRGLGLPLEVAMPLGTSIGALVLVGIAVGLRRLRLALAAFLAWAFGRAVSAAFKATVDRPRPPELLVEVALRQDRPSDQAFPSAHTTGAVALTLVAGWAFPRLRWPALGVAVLVALARMYVGVHLPLDLVGGAALGLLAGLAATTAVDRWWPSSADAASALPHPPPG